MCLPLSARSFSSARASSTARSAVTPARMSALAISPFEYGWSSPPGGRGGGGGAIERDDLFVREHDLDRGVGRRLADHVDCRGLDLDEVDVGICRLDVAAERGAVREIAGNGAVRRRVLGAQ